MTPRKKKHNYTFNKAIKTIEKEHLIKDKIAERL